MKSLERIRKILLIACLGSFSGIGFAQITIPVANDVYDIDFSADGSQLACTNENNVIIWDMETNSLSMHLESEHKDKILCLDYAPDDLEIATGGRDSMLIIWDIAENQPQKKFQLKTNGIITSIEYSPFNPILAFGNTSNKIYLFNYNENCILDTLSGHQGDVLSLTFRNENTLFSSGADGIIIKWDLENQESFRHYTKAGFIYEIDLDKEGKLLAAATEDGGLGIFRSDKNGTLKKISSNMFSFARYSSVDFGSEPSYYAYTTLKGKIKVITPYMDLFYKLEYPATNIRIQPRTDAKILVAVATLGGGVQIIEGKDLEHK